MTSQDDDIDRLIDELERAVFQRRTKEGCSCC